MKTKVFLHVVVNLLLIATVVGVLGFSLFAEVKNVFRPSDYAPIYRGNAKNSVSLMFNVYWGSEYIEDILRVLQRYEAKATFFVGGSWAADNPGLLRQIAEAGHELGNHGYFHKQHSTLTYQQSVDELLACNKLVFECVGVYPTLFAAPGGDFSKTTLAAAKDNGFSTIMWSRDTIDWRDKDVELIFSRATKDIQGGELILMHPTGSTLQALPRILEWYKAHGYEAVSVGKNIGEAIWNTSNNTQAD